MTESIESTNIVSEPIPSTEVSDPEVLAKIPLVSAFMMTYNHAPYIAKAIEGILQQDTNFPIELVIGEDCSTDGTREIVFNYQQKHPNVIRVITSEKNVGGKNNAQRVKEACRGKYIAFCDGDDFWHDPYKLRKQVDYLESHPECGLVYSSYDVYHCKSQKTVKDFIKYRKWQIIKNPKLTDYFLNLKKFGGRRVGILTCTVVVRRNIIEHIVESDPYLHKSGHFLMGDIQIWAELINISSVHYIPESMTTYSVLEESATRSKNIKKVLQLQISGAEVMIYLCNKYKLPSNIRCKFEKNMNKDLLRLSYYTRDAELAENLRKTKNRWDSLDWLRYYGAKNMVFYNIYRAGLLIKKLFISEHGDWQ
jgi:glycosyltransferase involved in cell wall biosynthesis